MQEQREPARGDGIRDRNWGRESTLRVGFGGGDWLLLKSGRGTIQGPNASKGTWLRTAGVKTKTGEEPTGGDDKDSRKKEAYGEMVAWGRSLTKASKQGTLLLRWNKPDGDGGENRERH